jgi:hypothetical protein
MPERVKTIDGLPPDFLQRFGREDDLRMRLPRSITLLDRTP